VLRAGQFGAGFGGLIVQHDALWCVCECVCCVWDNLEQVWGIECSEGGFVVCECVCVCVFMCCVWDSLEQVWGIECAAGGFVVCECVCVCVCECVCCI